MSTMSARGPGRPRKRYDLAPGADDPIRDRQSSSVEMLAERVRQVSRAWREGNVDAVRMELAALGAEASLLSRMYSLPLGSTLAVRQKVAAEKEPSGRGATS